MPSARFFNRTATILPVSLPQDKAGGEVPTVPTSPPAPVACAIQQDDGPAQRESNNGQDRRGSDAAIVLFFPPGTPGVGAIKAKWQIRLDDGRIMVADGPAFDRSGRGAVVEVRGSVAS